VDGSSYHYSLKVRVEADLAAADPARSGIAVELLAPMVMAVSIGDDTLSAAASWEPSRAGWRTRLDELASRYFGAAKRVFVTSHCYLGSLGGLSGADAACQSLADAAGLAGTFAAWISDAYDGPSVRLPHASVPYVLTDGAVVARDWGDLVDGDRQMRIVLAAPHHAGEADVEEELSRQVETHASSVRRACGNDEGTARNRAATCGTLSSGKPFTRAVRGCYRQGCGRR